MQDIYKKIFDIAVKEKITLLQNFSYEQAVMYKGFKISRSKGIYKWEDTRYDNYYEKVDPKITEKVLVNGFIKTLNEVMHYNDLNKVLEIKREIEKVDAEINYWTKESTKIWNDYNNKLKKLEADEKVNKVKKEIETSAIKKKYEREKNLYQKKRRVLAEGREEIRKDLVFYETRIKMNNN